MRTVLFEFLIRSSAWSTVESTLMISSSTLPTTFLALSLMVICHPNYQRIIINIPAAVPIPQKIKSKRLPCPKSYHALSSSYLWYISLTKPVMAFTRVFRLQLRDFLKVQSEQSSWLLFLFCLLHQTKPIQAQRLVSVDRRG